MCAAKISAQRTCSCWSVVLPASEITAHMKQPPPEDCHKRPHCASKCKPACLLCHLLLRSLVTAESFSSFCLFEVLSCCLEKQGFARLSVFTWHVVHYCQAGRDRYEMTTMSCHACWRFGMVKDDADFNGNLKENPSRIMGVGKSLQPAILQAEEEGKQSSSWLRQLGKEATR